MNNECQICGQKINWSDYDVCLKHAEEYHFDIFDNFSFGEVRRKIWKKGVFNEYVKRGLIKREE